MRRSVLAVSFVLSACVPQESASKEAQATRAATPEAIRPTPPPRGTETTRPAWRAAGEVRLLETSTVATEIEAVATTIADARAAAEAADRRFLVYIGASWCEPCAYFHDAAAARELDEALGGLDLLEFDFDVHGKQLDALGYAGRLIPRFSFADPDGNAAGPKIEGGIKGPAAVDQLRPRLEKLLRDNPPS